MNALSFCMMALGKRGDTIAIESPCYSGILQLAVSLGLKVLELPTHPTTGIDLDALKKVIPRSTSACWSLTSIHLWAAVCRMTIKRKW